MFTIGGWQGDEIANSRKADAIFEPGLVLRHLYDFGTTSETDIIVVGFREGKATTKHPISLLARNRMPKQFARNAASRRNGCVLNASTKRTKLAICAMTMLRTIRTRIMVSRCRCSTRREPGCAAMMDRPSRHINRLDNRGIAIWSGSYDIVGSNGAVFNNLSGASFDAQESATFTRPPMLASTTPGPSLRRLGQVRRSSTCCSPTAARC